MGTEATQKPVEAEKSIADIVGSILSQTAPEGLEALELMARAELAREDSPAGFSHFYWCVFGKEIPRHSLYWIERLYDVKKRGKESVIMAFRGSTKTTTLTIGFTAFQIGLYPEKANLLVQVGDAIAKDNTKQIADIVDNNGGFKRVFPYVIPDKERGWGEAGYEVKRTDVPYSDWRGMNAERKDPSLIGLGYSSSSLIGKHPTGVMIVDDINNEANTSSAKELAGVIKVVTGTLFPAGRTAGWQVFIGTPWNEEDVLAYVLATGEFELTKTPVVSEDGSPVFLSNETIEKEKRKAGSIEFARMYMLDVKAAAGAVLRREWLHEFSYDKINPNWMTYFGVDFASTSDKGQDRTDYFALAVVKVIPMGGAVIVDGIRERLSTGEAFEKVKALASLYPNLRVIGVEKWGKGEEFLNLLRGMSSLPVMPLPMKGTAPQSKGKRFETGLAPMFEYSRAWVSSAETPFLRAFREEWVGYPLAKHDDTLDAVYWALTAAIGHLVPRPVDEENLFIRNQPKTVNPFYGALR